MDLLANPHLPPSGTATGVCNGLCPQAISQRSDATSIQGGEWKPINHSLTQHKKEGRTQHETMDSSTRPASVLRCQSPRSPLRASHRSPRLKNNSVNYRWRRNASQARSSGCTGTKAKSGWRCTWIESRRVATAASPRNPARIRTGWARAGIAISTSACRPPRDMT